jgi:hypothetical protein
MNPETSGGASPAAQTQKTIPPLPPPENRKLPDVKLPPLVSAEKASIAPAVDAPTAKSTELSDQELMSRSKGGDMTPYAVLFKRHADRIWRMAYMILHSSAAAEDVTQETFTRGLTHIASYRGEAEPRAWFSSIALNLCRHHLRDKNKEAELADSAKLER